MNNISVKSIKISFIIIFLLGSPLIGQAIQNTHPLTHNELALIIALYNYDHITASDLIKHDINLNVINKDGDNVLHVAIKTGNLKIVKLIIEKGTIDIDAKNKAGNTALYEALINGKREVASFLIKHDININAHNLNNNTALHWLADTDDIKTAKQLLAKKHIKINALNIAGRTALYLALKNRKFKMAMLFIDNNVHLDIADKYGETPLLLTVKSIPLATSSNFFIKLLQKLISMNKPINLNAISDSGDTALLVTLKKFNPKAASLILKLKPNVDIINQYGDNALHLATKRDYLKVMRQILDLGIDINALDGNGNTALLIALKKRNLKATSLLIDYGANPNIPGNKFYSYSDNTPIHFAMYKGYQTLVLKMLDMKTIDVNIKNALDNTILHLAGKTGALKVLQKLFKKGDTLKFYIKNREGLTAHQVAIKHNQKKAITLFEEYETKLIHKRNEAKVLKNKNQNGDCRKVF